MLECSEIVGFRVRFSRIQAVSPLPQGATQGAARPSSAVGRGYTAVITQALIYTQNVQYIYIYIYIVQQKSVKIRDDQEEWLAENHLNLSAFLRDRLDEKIEQRSD